MFCYLLVLARSLTTLTPSFNLEILEGNASPTEELVFDIRLGQPMFANALRGVYYMLFYDLEPGDIVKYSYTQTDTSEWDANTWKIATEEEKKKIFMARTPMTFKVRTHNARRISGRGGYTIKERVCDSGTILTTQTHFDQDKFIKEHHFENAQRFCVYFLFKSCKATITQQNRDLMLMVRSDVGNGNINFHPGGTQTYTSTTYPLLLTFNFTSQAKNPKVVFTIKDPMPSNIPEVNVFDWDTLYRDPTPNPTISPTFGPTMTPKPSVTAKPKSLPWDGEWDDPPNVIIRGNDIPQILETHPPLQTEYVKTEYPKVRVVATISTGTIIAIVVIVFTVINFFRSAKKVKTIVNEFSNSDASDLTISDLDFDSTLYTYTASTATEAADESQFVINGPSSHRE